VRGNNIDTSSANTGGKAAKHTDIPHPHATRWSFILAPSLVVDILGQLALGNKHLGPHSVTESKVRATKSNLYLEELEANAFLLTSSGSLTVEAPSTVRRAFLFRPPN
jgi:hypothetical protein